VATVAEYLELWRLYGELIAMRKTSTTPEDRQAVQAAIGAAERDIAAAKADPALAAQIRPWWVRRYE
jgi:hypothetical protein